MRTWLRGTHVAWAVVLLMLTPSVAVGARQHQVGPEIESWLTTLLDSTIARGLSAGMTGFGVLMLFYGDGRIKRKAVVVVVIGVAMRAGDILALFFS